MAGPERQRDRDADRAAGGTFAQVATAAANAAAHSNTGLSPATAYVYRVRACNAVGCSGYSNEATATTPALSVVLSVAVRGSAGGTVTSSPAGISCGSSCSASFPNGALVTLTAAPGPGARFKSWGGVCSGASATCAVTMTDTRSVTATFSLVFTDATAEDLLPSGTVIKAIHFTELLAAINAAQGSSLGWSGPAPAAGGPVLAIHTTTLRQAVGLGAVTPASVIAAQHINEIRLRVRALE